MSVMVLGASLMKTHTQMGPRINSISANKDSSAPNNAREALHDLSPR